ncbi:MAG: hypothetical protein AAFN74_05985, partial [Myxococcota bacterium]
MSGEDLHDLIRQLRVELEWAVRTGITPPPPPPLPSLEQAQSAAPELSRAAPEMDGPPLPDEPPPHIRDVPPPGPMEPPAAPREQHVVREA